LNAAAIGLVASLTLIVGPLALAIGGWLRFRPEPRAQGAGAGWRWSLVLTSTLACTLAFNLTFFIQELFLVLPKALTPGLAPTLFHNNHTWFGTHPLAELFQGTGALATIVSAAICGALLARGAGRTGATRLFLLWMTYCGFLMALPQVAVGALSDASDLGRAMVYLRLGDTAKLVLAVLALAAMPLIALRLSRAFLALAAHAPGTAGARAGFVFQVAALPALLALVLIIPFRVPREIVEVVIVPVAVMVVGVPWIQAGAMWNTGVSPRPAQASGLAPLLVATLLLLAIFQLVLRPGIHFP
jgi:hypothetical protein